MESGACTLFEQGRTEAESAIKSVVDMNRPCRGGCLDHNPHLVALCDNLPGYSSECLTNKFRYGERK